jgi:DNA mismatch repair protein MutL
MPPSITVTVHEGGLRRISVIDDGDGIDKDDLPLCCKSHATSKVSTLDDLYHLATMGFRGEALYSVAACAKVTIASSRMQASPWQITVDNGISTDIIPGGPAIGTKVDVEDLFHDIPARRMFLKRPSSEATMCKNVRGRKRWRSRTSNSNSIRTMCSVSISVRHQSGTECSTRCLPTRI